MPIFQEDINKNLYAVVKDNRNQNVQQVVHLHETKIGTTSSPKSLEVSNNLTIEGDLIRNIDGTKQVDDGSGAAFSLARTAINFNCLPISGDASIGGTFFVTQTGMNFVGLRFYWSGSNVSIKMTLWDDSHNSLVSETVRFSTGIQEYMFKIQYPLEPGFVYHYTMYQTDGTTYMACGDLAGYIPARPFYAGKHMIRVGTQQYAAGDAFPSLTSGVKMFMIDPLVV